MNVLTALKLCTLSLKQHVSDKYISTISHRQKHKYWCCTDRQDHLGFHILPSFSALLHSWVCTKQQHRIIKYKHVKQKWNRIINLNMWNRIIKYKLVKQLFLAYTIIQFIAHSVSMKNVLISLIIVFFVNVQYSSRKYRSQSAFFGCLKFINHC